MLFADFCTRSVIFSDFLTALFIRNDTEIQKNSARYYFNIVSMVTVTLLGRMGAEPI